MMKVSIKNFESIGNISFEVDGFTVIVGKNNIGKSAVVRAIDAALSNRTGSEFIRWGKTKSEIKLQKDSLEIHWQKGDTATYKVNGENFSKLNRAIPKPVLEAGFRKIEIGDIKLTPLIAHQFNELFLVNKDTLVTDVLSVIYDLNILSDADDLCQKDHRTAKTLLKTRQSDLLKIQTQLEIFKDFEGYKAEFENVKKLDNRTKALQEEIAILDSFIVELEQLTKTVARLGNISEVKIPSLKEVETGIQKYRELLELTVQYQALFEIVNKLSGIQGIKVPEVDPLRKLLEEYQWVFQMAGDVEFCSKLYKNLKQISDVKIPDANLIEKMLQNFSEVSKLSEDMKLSAEEIRSFSKVSEISLTKLETSLQGIAGQIESWTQLTDIHVEFSAGVLETKQVSAELLETKAHLDKAKEIYAQYKVCPSCGKSL